MTILPEKRQVNLQYAISVKFYWQTEYQPLSGTARVPIFKQAAGSYLAEKTQLLRGKMQDLTEKLNTQLSQIVMLKEHL